MSVTVKLDTKELDRIAAQVGMKRDKIVEAFAFKIERAAKMRCPVDTGALRSSIHTRSKHGSTLQSVPLSGNRIMVDIPSPSGKIIAIVGSGMNYAAYVELGTHKMSAQPYLGPAVEENAQKLNDGTMWRELFT